MFLPAPQSTDMGNMEPFLSKKGEVIYSAKPFKTLATFDLEVEKPRYNGEVPSAVIKFYPLEK